MSSTSTTSTSNPASQAQALNLYQTTPLLYSPTLTSTLQRNVYLKLDLLQPSGSFKDRGVGHLCSTLQQTSGITQLISSSGGNAGLAVATAGKKLGLKVRVVVPKTTKALVIRKLEGLGAEVTVHGENWNAADELARQIVAESESPQEEKNGASTEKAAYVHPYEHELLWTGHSTVVDEVAQQLHDVYQEPPPSAMVVCVGGGGLLCGVLQGLARLGGQYQNTAVIACETKGASSFGQAWQTENKRLVRLDGIHTVATSLGALEVSPQAIQRSVNHESNGGMVKEAICSDAQAVQACLEFANEYKMLVEPACGAALAVVYNEELRKQVLEQVLENGGEGPVVVEVCGGSGVSLELLQQWQEQCL